MPIDIANFVARNFRGPDFEGAARLRAWQSQADSQNMLTRMRMDEMNEARTQKQALLGIIKSSTGPDGAFDYEGAANAVLQSTGDLDTATKLRAMKGSGTLEKMSQALKAAEYFRETSLGVKTPEQYQVWWSEVDRASREMGIPNTLPQNYDPAALKAWQTKQAEEYGPVETIPGLGVVQRGPGGEINVLRAEKEPGSGREPSEFDKRLNWLMENDPGAVGAFIRDDKSEREPKVEYKVDPGTGRNFLVNTATGESWDVYRNAPRGRRGRKWTEKEPVYTTELADPEYRTLNEGQGKDEEIVRINPDGTYEALTEKEKPQEAVAYKTADEVKAAFKAGKITREEAKRLIKGMQ